MKPMATPLGHPPRLPTRLPPLNALRAFEAAARHESFSRAADELAVTHSAVSHQIRDLEAALGAKLFRRSGRGVTLTEAGRVLAPAVAAAFDAIRAAVAAIAEPAGRPTLTLSVEPAFAARWLIGRIGRFQARHADIDVRLAPSAAMADFEREGVDAAIRYGEGGWRGLAEHRLMGETLFPVCAPALAARLKKPADLSTVTLLHWEEESAEDWAAWLTLAGVPLREGSEGPGVDPARGPRFDEMSLALAAAAEGQGVALASQALAADDLSSGRLVRPFRPELLSTGAYYLVYPPAHDTRAPVAAFRDWLLAEVEGE